MLVVKDIPKARTTTDIVFDQLREDILSLKILPGTKISEAEVATRMGVSRQPVRDAFNRLEHLDLLSIRPQRATTVRGFSKQKIANARFVRMSIELEVMRCAHEVWDTSKAEALEQNLSIQGDAISSGKVNNFHALDYEFHKLIFDQCGHDLAFEMIVACKQQVDRLCMLSLTNAKEVTHVFEDHVRIADALSGKSASKLETLLREHLGRLDTTIQNIEKIHADYFE